MDGKGTYHITNNNDVYEPARNNNFELLAKGLNGILKAGTGVTPQEDDYIKNGEEMFRVAVESSSVPNFELGVIEIKRGNNTARFAGTPTFPAGTVTLKDYISINAGYSNPKDIVLAWQALAYDVRTERVHRAANYKKTCELIEYSPDWEVVRKWTLEGCWISAVSEDPFTSESEGNRTFSATLQYDRAYPSRDKTAQE